MRRARSSLKQLSSRSPAKASSEEICEFGLATAVMTRSGYRLHLLHFLEQALEQSTRQVAFTGVRKDHDDGLARLRRFTRQSQRRRHRRAARYAAEHPLLAGQLPRHRDRFVVSDLLDAVDHGQIQVLRNET